MEEALSAVDHVITAEMKSRLTKEVTDDEIKFAAFQLGSLKALGPDGYPSFFYHQYWDVIGADVCTAVRSFFANGVLLKELNHTNLVLIPKIITKILASRLKEVLAAIISPNQSAFVPGRMIQDNILVAHEAFHYLKLHKRGTQADMATKLDFNKAYDWVQWDFLEAILQRMGFHEIWINWVM
ncbi:uncharacterized protein LOC114259586 [Camellia sinensis]|uniref:uncharacterized protein LOC114259586 n=1 Tax=Camellia sinensis TaxID=4442 RepID=UPI001035A654|nr:uncharacterized protein LOC114259586 [Camellia sinensis]